MFYTTPILVIGVFVCGFHGLPARTVAGIVLFAAVSEDGVSNMETAPRIIIIAGPNGAGKTTFARQFLPSEAACLIRRRFIAGKNNLERLYAPVVDAWALYDNAGSAPVLIDATKYMF